MTAPTRPERSAARTRAGTRSPAGRTTTANPPQRTGKSGSAAPSSPTRTRSAAAERAYQRRAQRSGKLAGAAVPGGSATTTRQALGPAPLAPFVVLVMCLLAAGVATTLWLSTQATADSYRLENAKQQATTLGERVERLQSDVAAAQAPAALAEQARKLGMVPARDPARLVVGENGKVRVVGRPAPAKAPPPPAPDPGTPQPPAAEPPAPDGPAAQDAAPPRDADAPERSPRERQPDRDRTQQQQQQGAERQAGADAEDERQRAGGSERR